MDVIGQRIGRWTITHELAGEPAKGLYRASDGTRRALLSTSTTQTRSHDELIRAFGYAVPGIAEFVEIVHTEIESLPIDVLVELEPTGQPITQVRPADSRALAHALAETVARAHAAGVVLGGMLRPELVYAEAGAFTGLAPRTDPFHAGMTHPSWGVPFPFEHLYWSVEAVKVQPITQAADVFSLCAVLAYVFLGKPPFEGEMMMQMAAISGAHPPDGLESTVLAGLDVNAARRPTALGIVDML